MIGLVVNPNYPEAGLQVRDLKDAAGALGLQISVANADTESGVDAAIASLARRVLGVFLSRTTRSSHLGAPRSLRSRPATRCRRAIRCAKTSWTGGLISYGRSLPEQFRQAGLYTGRILKGAAPADLPVTQPTSFSLVINLKTAKTLGLTIPPGILAISDEVIE